MRGRRLPRALTLWAWPGVGAPRPWALQCPLTGSLDLLRGFPEGLTVSPAARKAAILASISDTWGVSENRQTFLRSPTSRHSPGRAAALIHQFYCVSHPDVLSGVPFHTSAMVVGEGLGHPQLGTESEG